MIRNIVLLEFIMKRFYSVLYGLLEDLSRSLFSKDFLSLYWSHVVWNCAFTTEP